jgi:glyoxylase-like metal-dependent hydrolase (beta-lactamase superfamily II)
VAHIDILVEGYVHRTADDLRVAGTVSLIRTGDAVVIVDPGLVRSPAAILDPLRALGVEPGSVTDVIFSHHHPDHTVSAALFPDVHIHDVMATYHGDRWMGRPAEGFEVAPGIRLMETPGHTREDITTLAETADGLVAFTHLWWDQDGPADDPYTFDRDVLRSQRDRVLAVAARIVPGHGAPFVSGPGTPR